MTERLTHITDDELIDLAMDTLADQHIGPVLDHLAECDECAERSTIIHRTTTVWDRWNAPLMADDTVELETPWRVRVSQAIAELVARSGEFSSRVSGQLTKLADAPGTLASAAVGVLLEPISRAGRVLADATYTAGIADPPLEFAYVPGTRRAQTPGSVIEDTAIVITPAISSGAQVSVDMQQRLIRIEFTESETKAVVLLVPASPGQETMVAEAQPTPYGTAVAEFRNVPDPPYLMTVYVAPPAS